MIAAGLSGQIVVRCQADQLFIMSIPFSGNIQATSLPDIMEQLGQSKATGTLIVCCGGITKSIYLMGGEIVFAASTDKNDRLGEMLVRSGKISESNLKHALQLTQKSAGFKKLGAVLVENGVVTPKELFSSLKTQVKDIIYSLFLWAEGEYRFEENLPPDVIHLQINIQELITEIIQRIQHDV